MVWRCHNHKWGSIWRSWNKNVVGNLYKWKHKFKKLASVEKKNHLVPTQQSRCKAASRFQGHSGGCRIVWPILVQFLLITSSPNSSQTLFPGKVDIFMLALSFFKFTDLFRWKHIRGNMIVEKRSYFFFPCPLSSTQSFPCKLYSRTLTVLDYKHLPQPHLSFPSIVFSAWLPLYLLPFQLSPFPLPARH